MVKVKLVAVAKDEAAYLPYWVFHHLYFGFDEIDIYLNRTSDNSKEIISKINENFPCVNFIDADWVSLVDVGTSFQLITYAQAFWRLKHDNTDFTHVMFLDIDEFWTSKDFKTNIKDFIKNFPTAGVVSFNWMNVADDFELFSPLQKNINYGLRHPVKSIIKLDATINKMNIHHPVLADSSIYNSITPSGDDIKLNGTSRLAELEEHDFFILHRLYRSPKEYIASLLRGNPEENTSIKLNRHGYNLVNNPKKQFMINSQEYSDYLISYNSFLNISCINNDLDFAKKTVLGRYDKFVTMLEKGPDLFPKKEHELIKKVLKGINDKRVVEAASFF